MKLLIIGFILSITYTAFNQNDCLTIKSILVDACGFPEGPNEMVHLQIGENDLDVADISISWPNSNNNFLGFCQNPTTASTVDYMNSTILSCGHFLEPENGILPADANVLIITSVDFDATSHEYAGLMDTIYVIFQCAGNTDGHFANWQNDCNYANGFRTTTIDVAPDCQQTVTYNRCDLINQTGGIGGVSAERDGARVDFDEDGNPTYLNEGCTIPISPPIITLEYGDGITADNGFICANETLYLTANISSTISNFFWESDNGDFETPTELTSLFTPSTGAGNYFVYFVFENNCTDQQRDSLEITISPLPTVTLTGLTDVCLNATEPVITFTGGNGTAPYTFTYTINSAAQQTITSTGDVATITIPTNSVQNYTINLINVEESGTLTCSQTIDETVIVSVHPLPVVSITGNAEYCTGSTALLNAGPGFDSYLWSTGATTQTINATEADNPITVTVENEFQCFTESAPFTVTENSVITTSASFSICEGESREIHGVNQTTSGVYSQTFTSVNGCDSTSNVTLTVQPYPTALVTGTTEVCLNVTEPVITFTGGNGTAPYTFTYTINNGAQQTITSTGDVATITIPTNSVQNYTINLINVEESGTLTCSQTIDETVIVSVHPLPVVSITGNAEYCTGSTALLNAGPGFDSYLWSTGATTQTINATEADNPITVTVENEFQCFTESAPVTVTENSVITTSASFSICEGESREIHGVNQNTSGVYSQTFTSVNGCDSTSNVTLTVQPYPTALVTGTTEVCLNVTEPVITFTGGNGTAPYTFTYTINNGAQQTITSTGDVATITIPTNSVQNYTINLINVEESGTLTCSQTIDETVIVSVHPLPVVSITGNAEYCTGSTALLNAGPGFDSYLWSTGATTQTINATEADNPITVTVENEFQCFTESAPFTVTENSVITTSASFSICEGESREIHGVNQNTSGVYSQTFTSVNGCDSTSNVTLTVQPYPTALVTGTTEVCLNVTEPVITFTGGNGTAPYTFTYTINSGAQQTITSTGDVATITIPTNSVQNYTVNLINVEELGTLTCSQTINENATVSVHPFPVVSITGNAEYCQGQFTTLDAGAGFNSYLWSTGATTQTISATVANNPITVTVENEFQCFTESAPVTVTENPVFNTTSNESICEGQSILIHGVSQTTSGVYSQTFLSVDGCDSTSNVTLTVQPYPTALVTGTTEVCLNATEPVITFTGGNGTAPYTFTYTINSGAQQTITSTGDVATIAIPTNSVQNYTINLINVEESGTLTCSQTINENATVSVHPLPVVSITGNAEYCQGQFTTLDAGAGFDSYLWSTGATTQTISATVANNPITVTVENEFQCFTESAAFTVTENPVFNTTSNESICEGQSILIHGVSQTTSGVYSQTFTSLNGCDSTSNVTLTVYPLPTATITDPATVCLNSVSPLITFTGSNGTAPYTFTYRINNNPVQTITSAANSSTATLSAPTNTVGATTYTLVSVMDSSPMTCEQTINDDVTITVLQLPTASASGGTDVCINGDEPVITFTGNDGQAPYTFTYSINSGASQTISSTGNTATISVPTNTVGSFVYTLIDVTQSGTPACSQTQTESQIVVVHDIPNINAGNDISTCEGQTVILTASSNPPDQTITYNWDNGVTNEVPFLVTNTTTYTVTGVDQFGCENQDDLVITLIPTPTVDFTGTNLIGCSPLTSSFTNTSTGNLTNCVWTFSNGSSMTGCGTVSSTFVNPGCYDVTLTVSTPEGCSNTATQQNVVCVEPDPIADFVVLNPNMTILNTTAQFGNQSSGASSYIWSFGDFSPASTEESPSHIYPDEPGTYNVTLTAYSEAGCVDQISQIVIINDELIFYVPNAFTPDGDVFNEVFFPVFTSGFDPMTYTLLIFDRWGEIIFESHDTRYGWPGTYAGKIVQDGVYVWKIIFKRTEVDKREVYYGHVNVLR
jgi:gliding motility-associated-like protein